MNKSEYILSYFISITTYQHSNHQQIHQKNKSFPKRGMNTLNLKMNLFKSLRGKTSMDNKYLKNINQNRLIFVKFDLISQNKINESLQTINNYYKNPCRYQQYKSQRKKVMPPKFKITLSELFLISAFFMTLISSQWLPVPCIIMQQSFLGRIDTCQRAANNNYGNWFGFIGQVILTENYYFKGNSSLSVRFINFETLEAANPYYYNCDDSSPKGIYAKGDMITILCSGLWNNNVLIPEKTGAIFQLFTDTTSILEIGIKTPKPNSSTKQEQNDFLKME